MALTPTTKSKSMDNKPPPGGGIWIKGIYIPRCIPSRKQTWPRQVDKAKDEVAAEAEEEKESTSSASDNGEEDDAAAVQESTSVDQDTASKIDAFVQRRCEYEKKEHATCSEKKEQGALAETRMRGARDAMLKTATRNTTVANSLKDDINNFPRVNASANNVPEDEVVSLIQKQLEQWDQKVLPVSTRVATIEDQKIGSLQPKEQVGVAAAAKANNITKQSDRNKLQLSPNRLETIALKTGQTMQLGISPTPSFKRVGIPAKQYLALKAKEKRDQGKNPKRRHAPRSGPNLTWNEQYENYVEYVKEHGIHTKVKRKENNRLGNW